MIRIIVMMITLVFMSSGFKQPSCESLTSVSRHAAPSQWIEFASTEGAFSILLPGSPEETIRTVETAEMTVDVHSYAIADQDIIYVVWYCAFPELANLERSQVADDFFEGAQKGLVESLQANLVAERVISLDGHPGRELLAETSDSFIKTRIFLVGQRAYGIFIRCPKAQIDSKNTLNFLDSFKLVTPCDSAHMSSCA